MIHPIDWRLEQPDPLPTLRQLDGFVADYEAARGMSFGDNEHKVLDAGQAMGRQLWRPMPALR